MIFREVVFGIICRFQTAVGFVGNSLLFTSHVRRLFGSPQKKKPVDTIVARLTLANALTLAFRGVPNIIVPFGIRPEMGDVGGETVLSIQSHPECLSVRHHPAEHGPGGDCHSQSLQVGPAQTRNLHVPATILTFLLGHQHGHPH